MTKTERAKILKNARPFNFCLGCNDADFSKLSDQIYHELSSSKCFPVRGKETAQRHHVNITLLNLIYSWQLDQFAIVRYPLSKNYYKKVRYIPAITSYRASKSSFEGLASLGYLKVSKGFTDMKRKFRQTRVRPSKKLLTLFRRFSAETFRIINVFDETIILRDSDKNLIDYSDTAHTDRMRENLSKINECLNNNSISLYIKDSEYKNLNDILWIDKSKLPVDFSKKTLRRVFNNGSWDQGGRFYHGWWLEIPREYRKFVQINEKATVEIDFSWLHPVMLYAFHAKKKLKFDPYVIHTPVSLKRDVGKVIFNTLINSNDRKSGYGAIREKLKSAGYPDTKSFVTNVIVAFESLHSDISTAFFSGEGLRLQNLDSQIAEAVMLHFAKFKFNLPALPVHDSFIVHHAQEQELYDVMEREFEKLLGVKIKCEKSKVFYFEDRPESENDGQISFDELFNDDYSKYEEMNRDFFKEFDDRYRSE